jgi:ketosteroid isomerase-like protein
MGRWVERIADALVWGRLSDGLRGGADDHFVFATAVLDGKIANIPEYIDTQARARAAQRNASAPAQRRP